MMRVVWIVLGWFALSLTVQAASFDCGKASTKVEKLICAEVGLSKLDEELSAAYKTAVQDEKQGESIRLDQKKWMKERNGCVDAACLKNAYETRLVALKSPDGEVAEHDEYTLVKQDLDESTDYLFHIEPDPAVCQLYQQNLNYFAHKNIPMSCNRPIAPQFRNRIQEMEWEDFKPSDYPELFRQLVLIETFGRDKSSEVLKLHAHQIETKDYLFRRAKLELTGKTYRQFGTAYGLSHQLASSEYHSGKFFVIQYGRNDRDINAPVLPCKPIRGGANGSGMFYLVNDQMNDVINYLRVAVKGDYGRDKLLLIDGKLYAENMWGDATIHLSRVKQGDPLELELLCSYHFETSCRLSGKETFDPNQPMCKPNLN